jgi:hypothetical protein
MPKRVEQSLKKSKFEAEVNLMAIHDKKGSSSKIKLSAINKQPYISPYPPLFQTYMEEQRNGPNGMLKLGRVTPSASSSSHTSEDPDSCFDTTLSLKTEKNESDSEHSDWFIAMAQRDNGGGPRAFGGVLTTISNRNSVAIKPTSKNAELFYLCKRLIIILRVSLQHGSGLLIKSSKFTTLLSRTSSQSMEEECYQRSL